MGYKVTFYVPSKDKTGQMVSTAKHVSVTKAVQALILQEGGGFTKWETVGYWRNSEGNIMSESITVYTVLVPRYDSDFWASVAQLVKTGLDQESVLVDVVPCRFSFV